MIRLIAAGLCALFLGLSAPAAAQVAIPVAKHAAAMDSANASLNAVQVIDAAMARILSDMERASLASDADFPAAVEQLFRSIALARREIATQISTLSAIPAVAEAGDPPDVYIIDQMVQMTIDQARRMDRLLADIETMYRAYESGDEAKAKASVVSTQNIVVFMAESMALRLKGAAVLYPEGTFDRAIITGTACFYDGVTAYFRISFSFEDDPVSVVSQSMIEQTITDLSAAIACMQETHSEAGVLLRLDARRPMAGPGLTRLRDRLVPLRVEYLDNMEFGRSMLVRIHEFLASGQGLYGRMDRIDADMVTYEDRNADIARRTVQLNQNPGL